MIKKTILCCLFLVSDFAWSQTLKLEKFDQAKLGEILDVMSDDVRERIVTKRRSWLSPNKIVKLVYPRNEGAFRIICFRHFYGQSPVPSETMCEVALDLMHESARTKHDVIRYTLDSSQEVEAWFTAIPYGIPTKKFYSYARNKGITYAGKEGTVYHYRILCSELKCSFDFLKKILSN